MAISIVSCDLGAVGVVEKMEGVPGVGNGKPVVYFLFQFSPAGERYKRLKFRNSLAFLRFFRFFAVKLSQIQLNPFFSIFLQLIASRSLFLVLFSLFCNKFHLIEPKSIYKRFYTINWHFFSILTAQKKDIFMLFLIRIGKAKYNNLIILCAMHSNP